MKLNELHRNDYPEYYNKYLDQLPTSGLIDILTDQKQEMLKFLNKLDERDLKFSYAEGKWTVGEVLQHIIDTERIFQYRALCIARKDKTSLPGFDHDSYVETARPNNKTVEAITAEYRSVRESGIFLFKSFTRAMMNEMGQSSGQGLTAAAAGFIIAGHEKHHLTLFISNYKL